MKSEQNPSRHHCMKAKINLGYVIFLASTAALGGFLFGFDIAIITGAGPFLTQHFHLSDLSFGCAFSSLRFGCVIGSTAAGRLTDFDGRSEFVSGANLRGGEMFGSGHQNPVLRLAALVPLPIHHRR